MKIGDWVETPGRTIGAGGRVVALDGRFVQVALRRGRLWFEVADVEAATARRAKQEADMKAWRAEQAKRRRGSRQRRAVPMNGVL